MSGGKTAVAVQRDNSLEAFLAGHAEKNLREIRIVFHDENRAIARIDLLVVVLHHVLRSSALGNRRVLARCVTRWGWTPCRIRADLRSSRSIDHLSHHCPPATRIFRTSVLVTKWKK